SLCDWSSDVCSSDLTGTYAGGLKDGLWKFYVKSGDEDYEAMYKAGKMNGSYSSFYPGNKIKSKGNYLNGMKDGHWIFYATNGSVKTTGDMHQNLRSGYWIYFTEKGDTD